MTLQKKDCGIEMRLVPYGVGWTDVHLTIAGDKHYFIISNTLGEDQFNGAKLEDGRESVDPVGNFDISNFRNHRQYYYGMIHSDRSDDGMEICFFDKDTNWEVARY